MILRHAADAAAQDERGDYWGRWRAELARAIDASLYDIFYLDTLVGSGRAQCWFGDEACIVTELREYPRARAIHGLVAAGDLGEIVGTLIPRAEAWGRSVGCSVAVIESRPGWARTLEGSGYEMHQVALRKAL